MTMGPTTTALEAIEGFDLTGKVAVVTGASPNSIGLETARALVSAGATVVLGLRDDVKARAAVDDLTATVPGARVEASKLDLASLDSVRAFAAAVLTRHTDVDLLINNAGVMATPLERTTEGFELQFGTNHLAHFLLTRELLPALLAGDGARVINLSSAGHWMGGVNFDDVNYESSEYSPWPAYGQSKTANILFASELDRRYGDRGVHGYSVHPGTVRTDLDRHLDADGKAMVQRKIAKAGIIMKTPPQGASTTVVAATAGDLPGGAYLDDCAVSTQIAPYAQDADAAARLWTVSEQLVGETFPT
jgi:NAD(P)-dependent dehydrogenase (short-subunit alcohol dehydrogenase family)